MGLWNENRSFFGLGFANRNRVFWEGLFFGSPEKRSPKNVSPLFDRICFTQSTAAAKSRPKPTEIWSKNRKTDGVISFLLDNPHSSEKTTETDRRFRRKAQKTDPAKKNIGLFVLHNQPWSPHDTNTWCTLNPFELCRFGRFHRETDRETLVSVSEFPGRKTKPRPTPIDTSVKTGNRPSPFSCQFTTNPGYMACHAQSTKNVVCWVARFSTLLCSSPVYFHGSFHKEACTYFFHGSKSTSTEASTNFHGSSLPCELPWRLIPPTSTEANQLSRKLAPASIEFNLYFDLLPWKEPMT